MDMGVNTEQAAATGELPGGVPAALCHWSQPWIGGSPLEELQRGLHVNTQHCEAHRRTQRLAAGIAAAVHALPEAEWAPLVVQEVKEDHMMSAGDVRG